MAGLTPEQRAELDELAAWADDLKMEAEARKATALGGFLVPGDVLGRVREFGVRYGSVLYVGPVSATYATYGPEPPRQPVLETVTCRACGETFEAYASMGRKYCSRRCVTVGRWHRKHPDEPLPPDFDSYTEGPRPARVVPVPTRTLEDNPRVEEPAEDVAAWLRRQMATAPYQAIPTPARDYSTHRPPALPPLDADIYAVLDDALPGPRWDDGPSGPVLRFAAALA